MSREGGRLIFGDGAQRWSISDPECDELHDALHALRYGQPTRAQVFEVLAAAEAYVHLTTHPLGEHCVKQLRIIRRALRWRLRNNLTP